MHGQTAKEHKTKQKKTLNEQDNRNNKTFCWTPLTLVRPETKRAWMLNTQTPELILIYLASLDFSGTQSVRQIHRHAAVSPASGERARNMLRGVRQRRAVVAENLSL